MARQIIRTPSLPLSSYKLKEVPFEESSSGYSGLVAHQGYIPRTLIPASIDITSPLVKYKPQEEEPRIKLAIPLLSAAMQSVSGDRMAIALARLGGLATIYCSQPVEEQAEMIKKVKRHKGAFVEPEVVSPEDDLSYVASRMVKTGYSKLFVTEGKAQHGKLLGLITDNDFDAELHGGMKVRDRMRPVTQLDFIYHDEVGYDIKSANHRAKESRHSALPVLYRNGSLRDVIFRKDIREHREYKNEMIDGKKRLMVVAAFNTHDYKERIPAVMDAGADILLADTSQGWTDYVQDATRYVLANYPGVPLIGGNIVNAEGFRFLVKDCGVHSVKGGMGIGSICITPLQIGVARSQDKAIEDVAKARDQYFLETGEYVPVIADGGMRSIRDMLVALAFGANSVMAGKFFAGTAESPTQVNYEKSPPAKPYWGEGSERAKAWREKRGYGDFDEGVPAWVPYVGPAEPYVLQAMEQLRQGMRKTGCRAIQSPENLWKAENEKLTNLHEHAVIETISEEEVGAHGVQVDKS